MPYASFQGHSSLEPVLTLKCEIASMPDEHCLSQKIGEREAQFKRLSERIGELQKAYDFETRVDEKLRLRQQLEEAERERGKVENDLRTLQGEYAALSLRAKISDALRLERNKSFADALTLWQEIAAAHPDEAQAALALPRLQKRMAQAEALRDLRNQVARRQSEIQAVANEVLGRIVQMQRSNEADENLLGLIRDFLDDTLAPGNFVDIWKMECAAPPERSGADYHALADRLKRGEIVLFLGSDIPMQLQAQAPTPDTIALELARQVGYQGYAQSLSMIAEYYQMKPEYGRSSLLRNFNRIIARADADVSLYRLLAKIEHPLLLISSNYDWLLEQCLHRSGKKYAVLSHIIDKKQGQAIGSLIVQRCDEDTQHCLPQEQELSSMKLLETGYSLIYKMRGYSPRPPGEDLSCGGALTLAEENYFTFARHMESLIPKYLVNHFSGRGLFFLGHRPQQWEERLLVNALLDIRRENERPCVVTEDEDAFIRAYWDSRGVNRWSMSLGAFVRGVEDCLA
jgi:hypothetical protein